MRYILFVLPALWLSACQSVPVPPPAPPPADTAQLLRASQFSAPLFFLESPLYDPEVSVWIPQRFLDSVRDTLQATIKNPYTETQLTTAIARLLTPEDMQAAIDFYDSDAGQAVLKAELSFRERLNTPAARTATDDELLRAILLSPALAAIFMASADALIQRLDTYDCLAIMQIPGSNIGLNIAKRNRVGFMSRQVRRSLAQLYQPLSPEERTAYLQFAQSDAGQRYYRARMDAMTAIGSEFGARVAEAIAPGLPDCVGSMRTSGG